MLQNDVWTVVSAWPNVNLVYMQDGAPLNYATAVHNWLDRCFAQQLLGRAGPFVWHARDVYKTNSQNLDKLKTATRKVIGASYSDKSPQLVL